MTEESGEPFVVGQERKPCGCVLTEYSNNAKRLAPCVACGLFEVSQALSLAAERIAHAGAALGAVATTIRREQGPKILE